MDGWLAEENVRRSGGDVLFAVGGRGKGGGRYRGVVQDARRQV